ncbi:diacylglycerol/lipid kinase family protein [Dyadobacter psychrophilus]|uniref:Diacylglycerol kinase family enzyme n=1 Tax=Dyadobacter psychrophilus TaxID=651661 RepID=A0A1T5GDN2_9BACT|nr:diacylglycerol kinase family protein [Dyadobacter psychrophilus]SKC06461.1 Diacylglycerol kinase family enzyme [Dyadobacter psychrophilus]
MKNTNLLHNPTAGDNDFSEKELVKLIEAEGFKCEYSSVKEEGWDEFKTETDFLIIAGGDGTVRRVAKALMKRKRLDKQYPVALLPHGTANNIATALQITGEAKEIAKTWHNEHLQPFDIGKIYGLGDDRFFLEGFGYGIFPRLMKVMGKMEEEIGDSVEEKLKAALAVLYDIVLNYEAKECKIKADGVEHSGKYLMVEVMNIRSIGPNLVLAPSADPGDGELEVVLIPETQRAKFEAFILSQINGGDEKFKFTTIRAKNIELLWEGKDLHIDDERIKLEGPTEISIEIQPKMMHFLITEPELQ